MNWKGDANWAVHGKLENVDHILFECVLAKFVWTYLNRLWGGKGA